MADRGRKLELPLRARGVPKPQRRERVAELLQTVRLSDFADARPHQLSGGMRQRVALARALAQDADALLMDEPFGALDAMTRDLCTTELERIVAECGLTVLFVTHNVREAVRLGDRVIVLEQPAGRVILESSRCRRARPRRTNTAEVAELAAVITDRLHREGEGAGDWSALNLSGGPRSDRRRSPGRFGRSVWAHCSASRSCWRRGSWST